MKSLGEASLPALRQLIGWFRDLFLSSNIDHKVCYTASLDEVTVSRSDNYARIKYKEEGIGTTHLQIGPEIDEMSDAEIVKLHNECLRKEGKRTANHKYIAFEVPLGSEQIEYFVPCDQWVPRSDVLRCLLQSDERGRLVIKIDNQKLPAKQFVKLLTTFEGWGMRIEFVPAEEVHRRPVVQVRES